MFQPPFGGHHQRYIDHLPFGAWIGVVAKASGPRGCRAKDIQWSMAVETVAATRNNIQDRLTCTGVYHWVILP